MHFAVNLLSIRSVSMREWHFKVPSRPYWRLWWNEQPGAYIESDLGRIDLDPQKVVVVSPGTVITPFLDSPVRQFSVHYQLEAPFAPSEPGIFGLELTDELKRLVSAGEASLADPVRFRILTVTSLIAEVCRSLPPEIWFNPEPDPRLARVLEAMDLHIAQPLSNPDLARIAGMSPNAFVRYFTQRFGVSPQSHYMGIRLDRASLMLEYEDKTIEQISSDCGFCDRNYFSTVFRKKMGCTPAAFRKEMRKR